jgi:predicted Zn-dependent peptidase
MRRLVITIFLVFSVVTIGCNSLPHKNPEGITYPPLRFELPKAQRITLGNGIIIYFLEDHELPLVNVSAVIRTGSAYDPEGKGGLSEITGTVMRTGGTTAMTGDEIDDELDCMASSISFSVGRESVTASLSVLKENIDRGVRIFSDILINPVFDAAKTREAQDLKIEALRRLYDNPQQLAFREFTRIMYAGNPRGNLASIYSVTNIGRKDILRFYERFFCPHNVMMAVSGDIEKDELLVILRKYFGTWGTEGTVPSILPPRKKQSESISYIFNDNPQSIIVLGQIGPGKNDPDYFPFRVLDFILGGGGFNSRIVQEVRNNLGLAYSAGSFYAARKDYGLFAAYAMTKSASTAQSLSMIRSIIDDTQDIMVTEEELTLAKKSINSSFIFSFASADRIVGQQLMREYDGLPDDFFATYRDNINSVSREDVKRVALHYLSKKSESILVLGNDKKFDKPLSSFGHVNKIEVKNDG